MVSQPLPSLWCLLLILDLARWPLPLLLSLLEAQTWTCSLAKSQIIWGLQACAGPWAPLTPLGLHTGSCRHFRCLSQLRALSVQG